MAIRSTRVFLLLTALVAAACSTSPGVRSLDATPSVDSGTVPSGTEPPTSSPGTVPTSADGAGVGDSLFPSAGTPGVDVGHYDLDLRYDTGTAVLEASVTLSLTVLDRRAEVALDAVGLEVARVVVEGAETSFRVGPEDLFVPLPSGTEAGDDVEVTVDYRVDVAPRPSPVGLPVGWFDTEGGSYVLNEPDGARTWFPCNDHPSDKATYDITITVPGGVTGVANGLLVDHRSDGPTEVWHWREGTPMATYLVLVLTGDYELVEGVGPRGLPLRSAVLRDDLDVMRPYLDTIDDQIAWFEQWFGPYPLEGYGLAMTDSQPGLAMETQGRSLFSRDDFASGELDYVAQLLLGHELAHQWFGNAVTPAQWVDIWLNESFATYGEWMWLDHVGLEPLEVAADRALGQRSPRSTANPPVDDMFGVNSYSGGAVVLHALRRTVGDATFFEILRRWAQDNLGTSRTTEDFIALAEQVSGRSLTEFFDAWLFAAQVPPTFPVAVGA